MNYGACPPFPASPDLQTFDEKRELSDYFQYSFRRKLQSILVFIAVSLPSYDVGAML